MGLSIKKLLLTDDNWYYYRKYYEEQGHLRPAVIDSVTKLLSCRHYARGHALYCCSNSNCSHSQRVKFSCKDRACNDCGRVATDKWITQQKTLLPPTSFQHITFTMPSALWPFFEADRRLIGELPKLAANALTTMTRKKGITPGIFMAIHTFGRRMNWNIHLHVSVTRGGLTEENQWKECFFKAKNLMKMWRYAVITLLRKKYVNGELTIPGCLSGANLFDLFDKQYQKYWRIHCAKPHKNPKKDIGYLGRYIKRPAIANSRLLHYSGQDVLFKFLNHRTKQNEYRTLSIFEFIDRFTLHIPERHFRMIRYFGFLSSRLRGKLLPIVNRLFNHQPKETVIPWHIRVKFKTGKNPIECILCKSDMKLSLLYFGLSARQFKQQHELLALKKPLKTNLG